MSFHLAAWHLPALVVVILVSTSEAQSADLEIPFQISPRRSALLVEMEINGHPRTFILDTGCTVTMISRRVFPEIEVVQMKAQFDERGWLQTQAVVWRAAIGLGNRTWKSRVVLVTDTDLLTEIYGKRIDGLLGQDVLRDFALVTIDYRRRMVILTSE